MYKFINKMIKYVTILMFLFFVSCASENDLTQAVVKDSVFVPEEDRLLEEFVRSVINNQKLSEKEKQKRLDELFATGELNIEGLEGESIEKMGAKIDEVLALNVDTNEPTPEKPEVMTPEKPIVKKKVIKGIQPLNVEWEKNPGLDVKDLSREELIEKMEDAGLVNLENRTTPILRRIWLAYKYDQFFWDVHKNTGLPVSIIYSYFIIEATVGGVESKLMRNYMNPGGVKFRGGGKRAKAYDDCYNSKGKPVPCDFSVFETYEQMVDGWSSVFLKPRYAKCKTYDNAGDICKCLYRSGYHTANNWKNRANISRGYWDIRKSFPK